MKLRNLLQNIQVESIQGTTEIEVSGIVFDSRFAKKDALFVATIGTLVNGHDYIPQAIKNGASVIVYQEDIHIDDPTVSFVKVKDAANALACISSNFYGNPSGHLKLIGVTGTNGKTTIATLLYRLFKALGYSCGLISTIQNIIDDEVIPSTHTTPDAVKLNELLANMVKAGCDYCFMEVSSHAVVQQRIAGLEFRGGIFTNITHDHLDYHKTFDEYIKAKKMFFDGLTESSFAITNVDDPNGKVMLQNTKAKKLTYSLQHVSDFKGKIIENRMDGMLMSINGIESWFRLAGKFNAYNLLAIFSTISALNVVSGSILQEMSNLLPAEGRFDVINSMSGVRAVVDYAHTPDAIKNVLSTIRSLCKKEEKIITVIGAGGDRDRTKRPLMASISASLSDFLILTSDNPRSEDPEQIIKEMQEGISEGNGKNLLSIVNRKEAIKTAFMLAKKGDIVLVAGKGHEKYQEIQGVKHPFDDKQIINEILLTN